MTKFIKYKDELINLDLVASIKKSQYDDHKPYEDRKTAYTLIFHGAFDKEISCLHFNNKEIRDEIFNYICFNLEINFESIIIETKNEH